MSRQIDMSQGLDVLDEDDLLYLWQRDQITDDDLREHGVEVPLADDNPVKALQNLPYYGTLNTQGKPIPEPLSEEALEPRRENLTKPQLVGEDDETDLIEVPDDTDYENWTNNQLRAELADRGLSVEGKKTELQQRLRDHDATRTE